ncbi:MAG: DUF4389 domain-containing protein [Gammaproteobacteria bacterium]
MSEPDWTTHILNGAAWRRFGIMVLLVPILGCVGFFIAFTALFQFLSVLANGETTSNMRHCGEDLSRYATAIIDFLTYNSEHRPFPFASPSTGSSTATELTKTPEDTAKKKPAARKTSPRKRSTAKKTTKRTTSTSKKTSAGSTRATTPSPDKPSE